MQMLYTHFTEYQAGETCGYGGGVWEEDAGKGKK